MGKNKKFEMSIFMTFLAITRLIIEIGGTYIYIDFCQTIKGRSHFICNNYLSLFWNNLWAKNENLNKSTFMPFLVITLFIVEIGCTFIYIDLIQKMKGRNQYIYEKFLFQKLEIKKAKIIHILKAEGKKKKMKTKKTKKRLI